MERYLAQFGVAGQAKELVSVLRELDIATLPPDLDNLIEAMIIALAAVKETLGGRLADVTAFVTVTDSDAAEGIENASAPRINAADLAGRFLLRFS